MSCGLYYQNTLHNVHACTICVYTDVLSHEEPCVTCRNKTQPKCAFKLKFRWYYMTITCDTCRIRKTCKQYLKGFKCYYLFTTEQIENNKKE